MDSAIASIPYSGAPDTSLAPECRVGKMIARNASYHAGVELKPAQLDDLNAVERHFLGSVLRRARNLDAFSRGLFAESLVCVNLDGATLAPVSYQEWDLKWTVDGKDVTIGVRTTGARGEAYLDSDADYRGKWEFRAVGAFDPVERQWRKTLDSLQDETKRCWADIAVLAFHRGRSLTEDWELYVLRQEELERWPTKSVTPASLQTQGKAPVRPERLAEAIAAVVRSSSGGTAP